MRGSYAGEKPFLIHYQNKAWLLDSWRIKNDSISGDLRKISWNPADTVPRQQLLVHLSKENELGLDTLPHHVVLPLRSADYAVIRKFDGIKTMALCGGIYLGMFILFIVMLTTIPQP